MIYLSSVTHPKHRPMTITAAIATFLDNLILGPNILPPIVNDLKGNRLIDLATVRPMLKKIGTKYRVTSRVDEKGLLVIYAYSKG